METSKFQRILALTATPWGTRSKIKQICENLFIDAEEIRTYEDEEIKPHVQKKDINWIKIELSPEIKEIIKQIKGEYKGKIKELEKYNIKTSPSKLSKKLLLYYQNRFRKEINKKNPTAYYGISIIAQLIKMNFLLEQI